LRLGVGDELAEERVDPPHHRRIVLVEQHRVDVDQVPLAEREAALVVHPVFLVAGIRPLELRERRGAVLRDDRAEADVPAAPAVPVDVLHREGDRRAGPARVFHRLALDPGGRL
jgi:hypothetical protein